MLGALLFFYSLEIGYMPSGTFVMYEMPWEGHYATYDFYTDFEAIVQMHGFYAGGGVRTDIWKWDKIDHFWPHSATYRFLVGFQWSNIDIGWRHFCTHPVIPQLPIWNQSPIWESMYNEIFIKIEGGL
jgi:hypothetical protein